MTPPLRMAILGAGRRGMLVARVMMDLPGVEVVMLCDPNRHRLRLVQESFPHIQCTTTFQDVVENDWVDAAVVAVPLVKNSRVALALLNAGKHCLVEPPMATSSSECQEMMETAWSNDVILMCGHASVFDPAVLHLNQLIHKGELGTLRHLYFQRMLPGRSQGGGDVLWRHTCQDVAIALHWMQDKMPDRVRATGFSQLGGDYDMVHLSFFYDWGANVQFTTSLLQPEFYHRVLLAGTSRMALLDGRDREFPLRLYNQGLNKEWLAEQPQDDEGLHLVTGGEERQGEIRLPRVTAADPLREESRHFLHCIRRHQRPICDGVSGLRVVRLLELAAQSMQEGGAELPLQESLPCP